MKCFASDNYSGIHPEILNAIIKANVDHETSYGEDSYTMQAQKVFESIFGDVDVLYAFNGTGANIVSLKCCTLPFQAVICAETAHINTDEYGAVAQNIGCSLLTVPTPDGKLTPEMIEPFLCRIGNVHNSQPKVISISQSTELGTIYSVSELKALCKFAHENNLYVHIDGARISNAVATLNVGLKEATVDCGVDIMSFGGTKNGLMLGEAILIFNRELRKNAAFLSEAIHATLFKKSFYCSSIYCVLIQ